MSPKTKLLIFVIFIGVVVILLANLIDVPFRARGSALIVIGIAVILYALVTRIENRLRQRKTS